MRFRFRLRTMRIVTALLAVLIGVPLAILRDREQWAYYCAQARFHARPEQPARGVARTTSELSGGRSHTRRQFSQPTGMGWPGNRVPNPPVVARPGQLGSRPGHPA